MNPHVLLVLVHVVSATVWTGGHLVLALTVLPRAFRAKSVVELNAFEAGFEKVGIPALVLQVITGLWLASDFLPVAQWWSLDNPMSRGVLAKLSLLALTLVLAVDARLRIIPKLTDARLPSLAAHIIPVTVVSVLFVVVGTLFRQGGL